MVKPPVDHLKHVVVLMLENRSFDHILGAMPGVNGVLTADGSPKPELYNLPDPTKPVCVDNDRQVPFPIKPGACENAYITNIKNPSGGKGIFNHNQDAVFVDLDGPGAHGVVNGLPLHKPWPVYPATNTGFVYANNWKSGKHHYQEKYAIMSYFEWKSMKVLHRLAEEYVVCDNWFCDMPGHTGPNRAFMHCATAGGLSLPVEGNSDAANEPQHPNSAMVAKNGNNTIFQRLEEYGYTWKMYKPDNGWHMDTFFLNDYVMNSQWPAKQINCGEVPLSQFCKDVEAGDLPTYSFIMCFNELGNEASTSMHPYAAVESGENLLAGVYNALRNSKLWYDTLLIVNFDENGGAYDHVRPPRAVPPDPSAPAEKAEIQSTMIGVPGETNYEFDFSILGFRVPAILISPWLRKGIEHQQLQNTSVLRFLQDQFCAAGPLGEPVQTAPSYLTQRDRFANSIQVAFDDFGLDSPRTDCLERVAPYSGSEFYYANGLCAADAAVAPSAAALQAPPKPAQVDLVLEYATHLPGHADSGRHVARQFATLAELKQYAYERTDAATAYFNRQQINQPQTAA